MARFFQEEIGQDEGDQPKKKKNKAGNQAQETQGDETGFVHALTPKQKAEYDSLDKNQKEIVKYVLGVPGVDVSKIDLGGNKRKESTPPLPSERIVAHSGSGRSLGLDAGGGTLPLLARSFGSGTMEARRGGGTLDRQLLNGGLFAGVELLTEKLSSAALPFKAVYGDGNPALERKLDDLVTQAVRKFSASPTGQRILGGALSAGKSFVTEGLEEFVGDWLEWQLPRLYGGDVNSFSDQLASSLNSFFTGGLILIPNRNHRFTAA